MTGFLVPRRRRGEEWLDDPQGVPDDLVLRELRDVSRANALFGGRRAVLRELDALFRERRGGTVTLLDVGAGIGDVGRSAERLGRRHGVTVRTIGVELSECLARECRRTLSHSLVADAFRLPFRDGGVDVVVASQFLHHFEGEEAARLLREMHRVASRLAVVSDLRRSWLAVAGIWLASFPLGFHHTSREDGMLSVLRGFTRDELRDAVYQATGAEPRVANRLGFRVTASWAPPSTPPPA